MKKTLGNLIMFMAVAAGGGHARALEIGAPKAFAPKAFAPKASTFGKIGKFLKNNPKKTLGLMGLSLFLWPVYAYAFREARFRKWVFSEIEVIKKTNEKNLKEQEKRELEKIERGEGTQEEKLRAKNLKISESSALKDLQNFAAYKEWMKVVLLPARPDRKRKAEDELKKLAEELKVERKISPPWLS